MFFPASFISEILACIIAIFFFIRKRNPLIRYFVFFLSTTVIVETFGALWNLHVLRFSKIGMYNLFIPFEFIFYCFLFYKHFQSRALKKMIIWFIPLFLIAVAVNILFVQGWEVTFNTNTLLLGSFFIVVFCCCFFYESVLPNQIDRQLTTQPFFWIASGLLIYYLGSVIINALFKYLTSKNLLSEGIRIYNIINDSLNVVLYGSFCIAFYLCPSSKKRYSSQLS